MKAEKNAVAAAMYDDEEIRFLYQIKQEISPEAFSALVDYIKRMYELELKTRQEERSGR